MKTIKLFYIPISALLFTGLFASCNDDFVNTKPLSEVPQELVWTDAGLAQAFVNDLYKYITPCKTSCQQVNSWMS